MIIIPDIHINTKQSTAILAKLEEIFRNHNDKEVLFLGDYVYMFSYDRASLIGLYNIFLLLYAEGRSVRIMSGNHDRIAGHFVYDEVQKAFQIMNNQKNHLEGRLEFITQVDFRSDRNNNLHVVLPFNDHLERPNQSDYYNPSLLSSADAMQLVSEIALLRNAKNVNEQFSAMLNEIILTIYQTNKGRFNHIYIYHHYYTANITFPGVQSVFHFKDKALSPLLLDFPGLTLISGHIHEPFVYKNYICAGSFRNTSGGEINEIKGVIVGEPGAYTYQPHWINPRFVLNFDEQKTTDAYMADIHQIIHACASRMNGNELFVKNLELPPFHLIDLVLQYSGSVPTPTQIEVISREMHSFQVQKKKEKSVQQVTLLEPENADYVNELQSRKLLLENFLDVKYADQKNSLMAFLDEYKLLQ